MKLIAQTVRRLRRQMQELPLVRAGAKVCLHSGRIVRVRPLNLQKALLLLGILGGVVENLGWDRLARLSAVPAALMLVREAPEAVVDVLSLLTGEPAEIILAEFAPADAARVLVLAWRQEFAAVPLKELAQAPGGADE